MIDFSLSNKLTDEVTISNDILLVLQQIDMLFNTNPNTVLGNNGYGTNYDKYLYNMKMTPDDLQYNILKDIQNLIDLRGFDVNVMVSLIEGTVRDIALIDITIIGNYESFNTSYVIK